MKQLWWPCAGVLACAPVFAAGAQGQAAEPATLPEVVVEAAADGTAGSYEATRSAAATKTSAALRDVPQTVNVVPRAVLRDQNARSVQDALQNVAGLSFSVGDGQRDQVAIRGFTAIHDQFVDGVRDDAMYFRDLSNIERMEVLKGPASVLYGRGSAGGMVQRVTKKPQADPVREVGITLGNHREKRGEFDLGAASSDASAQFRLTGAVEDSGNFRQQYFLQRQAIAPAFRYQFGPRTSLMLQADYLHDKRLADQGVPSFRGKPVDVPVDTYFGAANGKDRAFVESRVGSATLTFDHAFSDALKFHSVLRHYDFHLDRNYTTIAKVTDGAKPTVTINQAKRRRDEHGTYWQNELQHTVQWGGMKHELLYGLELGQQRKAEWLANNRNAATYDLFNPVLAPLPAFPPGIAPSAQNRTRINIAALYLQDLVTLAPQWKLLAGLRYERLSQQRDDLSKANVDLSRVDTVLSPRVGVVYQPTPALSLYASYSKSFQPVSDSFVFKPNSDQLKPAQTVSKEVGVKYDLNGRMSLTAALFDMRQSNIQVADPANTGFALPVGEQRTKGVELSASGKLAQGWDLTAGYAYLDGKISRSTEKTNAGTPFEGNTAALTPRHSANFWLKRSFNSGVWLGGGMRAESARYASPDNAVRLPGYAVANLGAGYAKGPWTLSATLNNVFNRRYFVSAHSGANDYNMPGTPRSLLVSARYRF